MNIYKKIILFSLFLFILVNCDMNNGKKGGKDDDSPTESTETADKNIVLPDGKNVLISDPIEETNLVFPRSYYHESGGIITVSFPSELIGYDVYLNVVNPTAEKIYNIPQITSLNSNVEKVFYNDFFSDKPKRIHIPVNHWKVDLPTLEKIDENFIKKNSNDISSEKLGTKKDFIVSTGLKDENDKEVTITVTATCKYKKTVDTANGKRTLLVYLDNSAVAQSNDDGTSTNGVPTDREISILAGAFLRSGLDNDIYDKLTAMFGNDIGIFNAHSSNPYLKDYPELANYCISNNDYITILLANIGSETDAESYIAGYFHPSNNLLSYVSPDGTNERSMIVLNALTSGGEYLSDSLTTISHEFQHLIHNQYFNELGSDEYLSISGHKENDSANINEMFSSLAEAYMAYYMAAKTGQVVDGIYMVGSAGFDKGYIDGTEREYDYISKNGRGPDTLSTVGYNVTYWDDDEIESYGLVAGMANYLLVNYGSEVVSHYMQNGQADLDGIIKAINALDKSRELDMKRFLLEYGDSLLLSSNQGTSKPYSYNREGFYCVNNMPIYSTNLWLYRYGNTENYGFLSNNSSSYEPYSVNFYKVKKNASKGAVEIEVGNYDDRLSIDVVAVKNDEDIQSTETEEIPFTAPEGKNITIEDEVKKTNLVLSSSDYVIENGVLKFNLSADLSGADVYLNVVNPLTESLTSIPSITTVNSYASQLKNIDYLKGLDNGIARSGKYHIPVSHWKKKINLSVSDKNNDKKQYIDPISRERIGTKKMFSIYDAFENRISVTATCKYKKTVETANGDRTILVYLDNGVSLEVDGKGNSLNGVPTDNDISILAGGFLHSGLDNDIYDKLTAVYGNDIGIFNAHSSNAYLEDYPGLANYYISNNEYITILIADVRSSTANKSYLAGYYDPANIFLKSTNAQSNERSMIVLNAYAVGGDFMSESLTTLSHEFQHLIHDQYYNQGGEGEYLAITGHDKEDSTNINEMFSAIAEFYTAYYIAAKTNQVVRSPYLVGMAGFDKGYLDGTETVDVEEKGALVTKAFNEYLAVNGRAPYVLSTIGRDLASWDGSLYSYGLVAGVANYLLVNYGGGLISAYMKNGVANYSGILNAINKADNSRNIDMKTFLLEYGDALLLSSNPEMQKPYSYNREGFYIIDQMPVYSSNLWLYHEKDNENSDQFGFLSSKATSYKPCSVNFYKVIENANAGENEINIGTFDERIAIDVVIVK